MQNETHAAYCTYKKRYLTPGEIRLHRFLSRLGHRWCPTFRVIAEHPWWAERAAKGRKDVTGGAKPC